MARVLLKYRTSGLLESAENSMSLDKFCTLREKFIEIGICSLKKDQKNEICCVVLCTVGGTLPPNNPKYMVRK